MTVPCDEIGRISSNETSIENIKGRLDGIEDDIVEFQRKHDQDIRDERAAFTALAAELRPAMTSILTKVSTIEGNMSSSKIVSGLIGGIITSVLVSAPAWIELLKK